MVTAGGERGEAAPILTDLWPSQKCLGNCNLIWYGSLFSSVNHNMKVKAWYESELSRINEYELAIIIEKSNNGQ